MEKNKNIYKEERKEVEIKKKHLNFLENYV